MNKESKMKTIKDWGVRSITIFSVCIAATCCSTTMVSAQEGQAPDLEQLRKARPLQKRTPIVTYNKRKPGEEWVEPSITKKLKPGQRVDIETIEDVDKIFIQRLTDRTYWVWANVYCVTMYVGDESVLLIDSPETFPYEKFLNEMKKVTPLPISTVVYSHPHVDHVAGAGKNLVHLMRAQGVKLRIIASEACTKEIARHKNMLMMPTEVLPNGYATFKFEGKTFKYTTPVNVAHTSADSYTITPDGVAHVVDFFYPGILPLAQTSGVKDMAGYIEFLRCLLGDDWEYANLGHQNVGYKKDLQLTLDYHKDLYDAAYKHWPGFGAEGMQKFKGEGTAIMIRNLFDGVTTKMAEDQRKKWGHLPHWEVGWDHATMVLWDFALNWDYEGARKSGDKQRAIPEFSPIAPPEGAYK